MICEHLASAKRAHPMRYYHEGSAPWEMTFVCWRWRNTAISFPYLWGDIQLMLTDFNPSIRHHFLRYNIQLDRSHPLPIIIHADLSLSRTVSAWFVEETVRACRQVLHNVHRCSKLRLSGAVSDDWYLGSPVFPHM